MLRVATGSHYSPYHRARICRYSIKHSDFHRSQLHKVHDWLPICMMAVSIRNQSLGIVMQYAPLDTVVVLGPGEVTHGTQPAKQGVHIIRGGTGLSQAGVQLKGYTVDAMWLACRWRRPLSFHVHKRILCNRWWYMNRCAFKDNKVTLLALLDRRWLLCRSPFPTKYGAEHDAALENPFEIVFVFMW